MVARLLASPVLIVSAFAASVLAVQYRGRVRLPLGQLLREPSILAAPYNVLMYLFSAAPNRPVLPVDTIPELARLRQNWPVIRDEALALLDETYVHYAENTTDETRIILFCDIERPLHTRLMRAVNRWVSNRVIKETATESEAGERVGALNRMFGCTQRLRLGG